MTTTRTPTTAAVARKVLPTPACRRRRSRDRHAVSPVPSDRQSRVVVRHQARSRARAPAAHPDTAPMRELCRGTVTLEQSRRFEAPAVRTAASVRAGARTTGLQGPEAAHECRIRTDPASGAILTESSIPIERVTHNRAVGVPSSSGPAWNYVAGQSNWTSIRRSQDDCSYGESAWVISIWAWPPTGKRGVRGSGSWPGRLRGRLHRAGRQPPQGSSGHGWAALRGHLVEDHIDRSRGNRQDR